MGNDTKNVAETKEPTECGTEGTSELFTLGGRMKLRWDRRVEMSTNAHHVLFSAFLRLGGLFDRLVESAPLDYTSPNRPEKRDVIGTAVLGILDGAKRFRHFDSLTGDSVSAEAFGMKKLMSCDSVRRGMQKMDAKKGLVWVWRENLRCVAPILPEDYVLDLDPTVKTLYGHQEGAVVGYNPHKPGHPGQCLHTMCIAALRMAVGVVVLPGDETAGTGSVPMLSTFLGGMPAPLRPRLARGDVGLGKEPVVATCEVNDVRYLFKVMRSAKVKAEWRRTMGDCAAWLDAGEGWQVHEFTARLQGWTRDRRMVLVRRPDPELARAEPTPPARPEDCQLVLFQDFAPNGNPKLPDGYEWYALVTNLDLDAAEVARLYRQRGDCENIFDEMKNDWGWGGFSAHDLGCTAILAGLVALVANWWNLFCRIGEDGSHREAKTSRPLLQRCVASISEHAREKVVTLYTEGKEKTRVVFADIAKFINRVATASQLAPEARWMVVVRYSCRQFAFTKHEFPPWVDDQYMLNL